MDLLKKPTLQLTPPTRSSSKRREHRAPERGLQAASTQIHETTLVNAYKLSKAPIVNCRTAGRWKRVGIVFGYNFPAPCPLPSRPPPHLAPSVRGNGSETVT